MKNTAIAALTALLVVGCAQIGPEPTVTQADRDTVYRGLDFRKQCLAVVDRQPIQSVDPGKDCDCVHRATADLMPAWLVRRTVDGDTGVNRTPFSAAEQARLEREVGVFTTAAYRKCGVVP